MLDKQMSVCYAEKKEESMTMFNLFTTQMSVVSGMSKTNSVRHGFCVGENMSEVVVLNSMSL